MDPKRGFNKQFSTGVNFAPGSQSMKRDPRDRDYHPERSDSLSANALLINPQSFIKPIRKESQTVSGSHGLLIGSSDPLQCRFRKKWRTLSYLQIFFGALSVAVNLYMHYPLFSCGWRLSPGEDKLWFGTWVGVLNIVCGIIGSAANKPGLSFPTHKWMRRAYFILNCSFVPFANGIGMGAFGITLSAYPSICNFSVVQNFTLTTAFINLCLLIICLVLNLFAIAYQVLATLRCKCWLCDPKNRSKTRGYVRT